MSGRSQLQRALLDAATILSSAANVARRAAVRIDPSSVASGSGSGSGSGGLGERSNAGNKKTATATSTTPWPSQMIALQGKRQDISSKDLGLAPSAPDGHLTEMRVLNKGAGRVVEDDSQQDTLQDNEDLLRQLDDSLKGYFEEPEAEAQTRSEGNKVDTSETAEPPLHTELPIESAPPINRSPTRERNTQIEPLTSQSTSSSTPQPSQPLQPSASIEAEKTVPKSVPLPGISTQAESTESIAPPDRPAPPLEVYDATLENSASPLRAAKVPSSRVARLLHYGSLGAGLAWGAAGSYFSGGSGSSQGTDGKQFMSDGNVRRLVDKLSTMRGAALKLGQFMSIQDSNLLPEQIEQVMLRVQNSANYMPIWQMERVMREDLGDDWRKSFASFNDVPFASASIGQVHIATLSDNHPSLLAGQKVAVKIQFPGVRESIGSDLSNLRWLVSASSLLPKGLFLDNTIRVMRRELDDECDYEREKEMCKRFGMLLNGKSNFAVPRVVEELCSKRVLTCEMMKGRPLTQAARYSQEKRDNIARSILQLSLEELFIYRLMQTDPNWTNFLYNEQNGKIELIDFGATREYDKAFMDDWLCMLRAAIGGQRQECVEWSEKVGYLTGKESKGMQDAHVDSMIALGEPFRSDAPSPYPFAQQTITARVRAQIPLMLRERLTPPPEPTYSLNRKLSGAFLLCARLKANVECRTMLQDVTKEYILGNQSGNRSSNGGVEASVGSVGIGHRGMHTFRGTAPSRDSEQRRRRLGNLAARWPRHILEAMEEQNQYQNDKGYISLAATPVSPSMSSMPSDAGQKTSALDLRVKPSKSEEEGVRAESPLTAMDLAKSRVEVVNHIIRGISIPNKPSPPGPEDCCMSGCAHCVYDIHLEALTDYHHDLLEARKRLLSLNPPISDQDWNVMLLGKRPELDAKLDGPDAARNAQDEVDAAIEKLDPSMKAFLQLERSIKKNKSSETV